MFVADRLGLRACGAVPHAFDVTTFKDGKPVFKEEAKHVLAVTQDASDYVATLLTKAEFGCVRFEEK